MFYCEPYGANEFSHSELQKLFVSWLPIDFQNFFTVTPFKTLVAAC